MKVFTDPAPKPASGWLEVAKVIVKVLTKGGKGGKI